MLKPQRIVFFSPLYDGTKKENQTFPTLFKNLFMIAIGFIGFVFCMTLLYHAMRGVMDLGGFVASGGPYHIAHQAPGWVWVFPVSILAGIIFLFFYSLFAKKIGGLKLTVFAWPALFCSLGYNFLAYTFIPAEKGGGIAWGWLICGVLFELMGGIPLIIILKETARYIGQRDIRREIRNKSAQKRKYLNERPQNYLPAGLVSFLVFIINLGGIAAGVYLAIFFFQHLTN